MMRLLISCFVLVFFTSCSLSTTKNLLKEKEITPEFVYNPYFSNNEDYVYKAKINAFGSNFGGILIIKKIKEDNFRIVFTSEFGNKFFDFELHKNQFKTNFILEAFNRKAFVKILQNDFLTLLKEKNKVLVVFKGATEKVYKTGIKKKYNYFFIEEDKLARIVHTTRYKELTIFNFKNSGKEILIQHKRFPLKIDLKAFD